MSAGEWGQSWSDALPQPGALVTLIDNRLDELTYPVPVTLCFARTGGDYQNADARAVIDWSCGAFGGRLRCDWHGQGAIVASRIRVSLESYAPLADSGFSLGPVGTPPAFQCSVGLGAINPKHPLTYTTPFKQLNGTLIQSPTMPPPAFARMVRALGSTRSNQPNVITRNEGSQLGGNTYSPAPIGQVGDLVIHAIASSGVQSIMNSTGWAGLLGQSGPRSSVVRRQLDGTANDAYTATANAGEVPAQWLSRSWAIRNVGTAAIVAASSVTAQSSVVLAGAPLYLQASWPFGMPTVKHFWLAITFTTTELATSTEATDWTNFLASGGVGSIAIQSIEKLDVANTVDPPDFNFGAATNAKSFVLGVRAFDPQFTGVRSLQNQVGDFYYSVQDCSDAPDQLLAVMPLPDRSNYITTAGPLLLAMQYELGC